MKAFLAGAIVVAATCMAADAALAQGGCSMNSNKPCPQQSGCSMNSNKPCPQRGYSAKEPAYGMNQNIPKPQQAQQAAATPARATAVQAGELLTEIRLPRRPGAGSAHEKVERRAGDWAIAAASVAVWVDGGQVTDVGIALSAVGLTTIHVTRAEELLRGKAPSDDLFAQAGEIASEDCSPTADGRGPVDYKRHLSGVLTQRALRRATARALGQEA